MPTPRFTAAAALMVLASAVVYAGPPSAGTLGPGTNVISSDGAREALVIPVAGTVDGANNTHFQTDLTLANYRDVDQDVIVYWLERGKDNSNNPANARMTIPARKFLFLDNFVPNYLEKYGVGALRIRAVEHGSDTSDMNARIDASARIWTYQPESIGTVSQSMAAVAEDDLGTAAEPAYVMGLRADGHFRTNVGIVNLANVERKFTVSVRSTLGRNVEFDVKVAPYSMEQVTVPEGDRASVAISITPDQPGNWTAYATSIDNSTGDSWTSKAQSPTTH